LAKFTVLPQLFSALFFFMLLTLGIGTIIAQTNCFMTVIRDQFPGIQHWKVISGIAVVMVCLGSIYLTPNGQPVLKLVDFFGCSFVVLILAIMELITISWIYGVDRLCKDIEFMLGFRPSIYWRMCWKYIVRYAQLVIQ
jgi:solute carrier family 6 amino acid transporter-like protein 5/7/9/14